MSPRAESRGEIDCGIVKLREWRRGDEDELVAIADNPNVARFLRDGFPSPYTYNDATDWIFLNETMDPRSYFAIVLDERIAGGIGLTPFDAERAGVAEIGYWIGEPYWGRGIATAAARGLTAFGFERLALRRIEAPIYAPNKASMRVLEKCGYVCEGIMRDAVIKNGQLLDAHLYARLYDQL